MILKWARVLYTGSCTNTRKEVRIRRGKSRAKNDNRRTDPGNAELFPANVRLLSCRVS